MKGRHKMANTDLTPNGVTQGSSALYKFNSSPNTRAAISQKVRLFAPVWQGRNPKQGTNLLYQMGVVSSFEYSLSRSTELTKGIGFGDHYGERVPNMSEGISVTFSRTLLYLANAMQATGYAGGYAGPVRSFQTHRWPFDMEEQMVFSSIADAEADVSTDGFQGGVQNIDFSFQNATGSEEYRTKSSVEANRNLSHKAIITYFEACWFTSLGHNIAKDTALIDESVGADVSDIHDLFSTYGEFMNTGNDPTLGQGGSIRYAGSAQGASRGLSVGTGIQP